MVPGTPQLIQHACDLSITGARVVMACRDLIRAESAAEEIRTSTGNGNVVVRHLDLASLHSIRQFTKEFLDTEERLDILVNNAGELVCRCPPVCLTQPDWLLRLSVVGLQE